MALARRLALAAAALGCSAAVVGGATLAAYVSQATTETVGFAAGTVILGRTGGSAGCTISGLAPGEASTGLGGTLPPCTYTVAYQGSLAGWVGLDVTVSPPGGLGIGTPDGLEVQVTDSYGNQFVVGQLDQLVRVPAGTADANPDGSVRTGWQDTFTVNYALPADAPGSLADQQATVTLQAHAVQESNDPLTGGCPSLGWGDGGPCGGGTTGGACQPVGTATPVHGCTQGYWAQKGASVVAAPDGTLHTPVTLGEGARAATLTTLSQVLEVFPPTYDACAATLLDCGTDFAAGLDARDVDHLASQTLALAFNLEYVKGFAGESLAALGCVAGFQLADLGLSGSSTTDDVLAAAQALLGGSVSTGSSTAAEVGDMTDLLGQCVNAE